MTEYKRKLCLVVGDSPPQGTIQSQMDAHGWMGLPQKKCSYVSLQQPH